MKRETEKRPQEIVAAADPTLGNWMPRELAEGGSYTRPVGARDPCGQPALT